MICYGRSLCVFAWLETGIDQPVLIMSSCCSVVFVSPSYAIFWNLHCYSTIQTTVWCI